MKYFLFIFLTTSSFSLPIDCVQSFVSPQNHLKYSKNIQNTHYHHFLFKRNQLSISKKYKDHPLFNDLSFDPDHGKVTKTSELEAVTGIKSIKLGFMNNPITRGPKGSEFIDSNNVLWDVKTPISPHIYSNWKFSTENAGMSIKKKLEKKPNFRVIIDKSYIIRNDYDSLRSWIKNHLTKEQKKRIFWVQVDQPFSL